MKRAAILFSMAYMATDHPALVFSGNVAIHNSTGCQPKKNNGFKNTRRLEIKANRRKK
jgi:hypothetical protein